MTNEERIGQEFFEAMGQGPGSELPLTGNQRMFGLILGITIGASSAAMDKAVEEFNETGEIAELGKFMEIIEGLSPIMKKLSGTLTEASGEGL